MFLKIVNYLKSTCGTKLKLAVVAYSGTVDLCAPNHSTINLFVCHLTEHELNIFCTRVFQTKNPFYNCKIGRCS
jgi:hypothetical protein